MGFLKKVFIGLVLLGVFLGVMTLFGNNPFRFVSWCFDWCVWFVNSIANFFSHNQTTQDLLSSRPGEAMS